MAVHKRKRSLMNLISGIIVAGLLIILSGCGNGLPKKLKKEAKTLPDVIKTYKALVDKDQDKYKNLTKSSQFQAVKEYALKENWTRKFELAHDELKRAKEIYDKDLSSLIKKDRPELANEVRQQITRIKKITRGAQKLSRYPLSRFLAILDTIKNAEGLESRARENGEKIKLIANKIKTNAVAKAIADFPDLTRKINTRFAPLLNLERQSQDNLKIVAAEFEKHKQGSNADYAAFTDSANALFSGLEKAKTLESKLTGELSGLYKSYTKILKDMKEEYFVIIKRESWNDNSDYYDPRYATFQREVTKDVYEALTADGIDTIAAITAGFTGSRFSSNIGRLWDKLSINPTEQWPGRGHNAASFWVESSWQTYFHKYILEENGETKETGWEQVGESFYDDNIEYLGMAILAKPYGVFEKDRLVQAAPPGMAYVGNSKYGEWKNDNKGDRFWSWYGKYSFFSSLFFFPPSYFGYNSWYGWHNNYRYNRPYFGKTRNGFQKYGTSGTYIKKSPRFQSTNFAKSGGFRSQTASVRGAGPNLRGGGPKNKGK
ncbi:MAG: hypothetical protein GXP56_16810 [Deltaproteobacteria bacterium]|nr:hypothetical protein [Deltaproteobacteria bacterium]